MDMVLIFMGCILVVQTIFIFILIIKYRKSLFENELLIIDKKISHEIILEKDNHIESLRTKTIKVGATFIFGGGDIFLDELVGKRSKIVALRGGTIVSKLINNDGDFISDETHTTGLEFTKYLIFEQNSVLKHEFV
jgi:hypothetical protein